MHCHTIGQHQCPVSSAPTYIYPIELATRNESRTTSGKKSKVLWTCGRLGTTGTSGIRSSDTPILVEDEDESEDHFDPELYYSSPSSAKTTEEVRAFIDSTYCRGQVGLSFHFIQTQTDLQQVQTPTVIRRSIVPVPRAQKANMYPTQCQDTTTTIKQQGRPVGGALSFHHQEWQKLTDHPWIIQCTQGYHLELIGTPPENYPVLSPQGTSEQSRVLERGSGSPSKGCNRSNNKIRFLAQCSQSQRKTRGSASLSTSRS